MSRSSEEVESGTIIHRELSKAKLDSGANCLATRGRGPTLRDGGGGEISMPRDAHLVRYAARQSAVPTGISEDVSQSGHECQYGMTTAGPR
jgi:hypothetical protein